MSPTSRPIADLRAETHFSENDVTKMFRLKRLRDLLEVGGKAS